jgi:hypothetical protein
MAPVPTFLLEAELLHRRVDSTSQPGRYEVEVVRLEFDQWGGEHALEVAVLMRRESGAQQQ